MAEKILNTRILLKYDTLENWNATTSYLRKGEVAIATVASGDTQEVNSVAAPQVLVKVGDGKTLFRDLPFITAKAGDVYGWAKKVSLAYEDLPKTLKDEIDALQAAVGTGGSVTSQIAAAIEEAVNGLDVEDAEVTGQFVVAVPQTDGKVAPVRRALTATDIPELEQSKITGLTKDLGDLNTAIANETSARETAVQGAKDYADQKVTALADGVVATNTAAIAAINDETTGILAQAKADATTKANDALAAAKADATTKADEALVSAKSYTDEQVQTINGVNAGLSDRVKAIEDDYLKEEDKTILAAATTAVANDLATEIKERKDTNTALDNRLKEVETFFEFTDEEAKNEAYDTLKEIQDYITSDQTGATEMLSKINKNSSDIDAIKADYLKAEDKTALEKTISDEASRATAAEGVNATAAANAKAAADAAQEDVNEVKVSIGTVPTGKTVVQMIADAQTAATYDDAEVRGLITANTQAITDETAARTAADTQHTNDITAINNKIGAGTIDAGSTLVAAINKNTADIAAEVSRAEAAEKKALEDAQAYTDELKNGQVKTNTDAITAINNDKTIVKSVEGDDIIKASIADNKLTIDFDDTLTFIFDCGTSAGLDATTV